MRADDRALADLAASVADGSPVNWQVVESGPLSRNRRLAGHLRLVETIAALHRSIPLSDGDVSRPAALAPEGKRWGRLVLLEQIGEGASCDVYRAWDSALHRDVALKLLHTDGSDDEGVEEARRLARLRHEHVVQVYGAETHDGRTGLWTELVRGESLEEIVTARGPLGPREAALVGLDVCAALAAVHGAGLLHRDVKAQNVMREAGGRIVLMDFGTGEDLAGSPRLIGTPLYLAPEIFAGQSASVQSDIYGVGVMLFYLVTGTFPVVAASMDQLRRAHLARERQTLRDRRADVPEAFVKVVERALESDPTRRFRSVGELEAGLRESLDRPGLPAQTATTVTTTSTSTLRSISSPRVGWAFVASTAALVLVCLGLLFWARQSSTGTSTAPVRVAVLPFRDISPEPIAPYLAEELTGGLISTLGHIHSLQVPSLTTSLQFRDRTLPIIEIGRQLRADDVVEATLLVVKGDDGKPARVRVNARLIAAGTDSLIWAQEFERSMGDLHALQAELARAIASGIKAALTPGERQYLKATRSTAPAANEAYYQGLNLLSKSSADGRKAVEAFRRAIAADPDHPGARAGLARGLMAMGFQGAITNQEARALALAEANRAIALDSGSAEGHAVLADLRFYYDWDWKGAAEAYERAIELNPSFARARSQYARYLAAARQPENALAEAARGAELEPLSASAASTQGLILYYARDYSGARSAISHALQLEPQSAGAYFVLARIDAARGDISEAIVANERALAIAGDEAATGWRTHLLRLRALAGDVESAWAGLEYLPEVLTAKQQGIRPTQFAFVYEALGDRPRALGSLEKALAEREPDLLWLAVDPRVDSLRSEPRFVRLIESIGIPTQ